MKRQILGVLLFLGSLAAIHPLVITPYRLNVQKKFIQDRTLLAISSGEYQRPLIARQNITLLSRAAPSFSADSEVHVIRAANFRLLGRTEDAISEYRLALRLEKRPEIYYQLGRTYQDFGAHKEAEAAFRRAAAFSPLFPLETAN